MNRDTWSDVLELVNHQLVHLTPGDPAEEDGSAPSKHVRFV